MKSRTIHQIVKAKLIPDWQNSFLSKDFGILLLIYFVAGEGHLCFCALSWAEVSKN
jgi:hypothetical protein